MCVDKQNRADVKSIGSGAVKSKGRKPVPGHQFLKVVTAL